MKAVVLLAMIGIEIGIALLPQASPPSRAFLNAPRALTAEEIDITLHAAQAAIAGKTLHLVAGPRRDGGIEVVMSDGGRPQRIVSPARSSKAPCPASPATARRRSR
jgi:hypothetical protein